MLPDLRNLSHRALPPLIVGVLAFLMTAPHVFPLTSLSTFSYAWFDADVMLWDFWWTKRALTAFENPYWTSLLFHPAGTSLALHAYPLPYSLISVPLQAWRPGLSGLLIAFNLVVIASSCASGVGAYFLAARVTGSRAAGVVAGVIFAAMPYRFLNVSRLYLVATEFLAWYVLLWVVFAERPTRVRATLVGVCLALTFYTSPEYALYCAGFSALWLAWRAGFGAAFPPLFFRRLAVACLVTAVLALPLLILQARAVVLGDVTSSRTLEEAAAWSPALVSFVTPSRFHPIYGRWFRFAGEYLTAIPGMRSESTVVLTAWCLALIGVWRMRRDRSVFWVVAAAMFLVLALGPTLRVSGVWTTSVPLPYTILYYWMPLIRASRDPTRLVPIATLMISVVAAFGARACLERMRGRGASAAAAAVLVGAVLFESFTGRPLKMTEDDLIDPMYARIRTAEGTFAVMDLGPEMAALVAQTVHGRPITAGALSVVRSGSAGRTLGVERDFNSAEAVMSLAPAVREARLAIDGEDLAREHIRFVVFPRGRPAQVEMARALGLGVSVGARVIVCERIQAP